MQCTYVYVKNTHACAYYAYVHVHVNIMLCAVRAGSITINNKTAFRDNLQLGLSALSLCVFALRARERMSRNAIIITQHTHTTAKPTKR